MGLVGDRERLISLLVIKSNMIIEIVINLYSFHLKQYYCNKFLINKITSLIKIN